jgi:hypothetical protein
MLLVKISSKLEGINLIRNIYDNILVYFLLINNKLLYMIIFLSSYRAKSSKLGLAQDQLVFQSSYIRRSYSAHFLLSRSRVELRNELISSRSRVSSFSCIPKCQFSVFCCFCVSEKLHRKYSWNRTKQVLVLLFFPDEGRGPNGSRRGARGWPHNRGARPSPWSRPPIVRPPWSTSDDAPSPIRSLPAENPKRIGVFPRTVPQLRRRRR